MDGHLYFISAGEPSGDNAAARLAKALLNISPQSKFIGLGGPQLAKLGQEQIADMDDLAVIGFWEVAKRFMFFKKLMKKTVDDIKIKKPSAVILIDYPGFNLRLAKKIKKLNIPIIYYISPQVWAWGSKRIDEIKELIDLMIPILPFEEKFYKDTGINCTYAGNYLLEDIPPDMIASSSPDNNNLAILPGSRKQEIERMLPVMLETAKAYNQSYNSRTTIAAISGKYDYDKILTQYPDSNIDIVYDNPRQVIFNSRLVLTASGTATLETGIIGRPMVIIYKTGNTTYQIAKRLIKLDKIGLINLVLDEKVVPELIQQDASPEKIMDELNKFQDERYYQKVLEKLHRVVPLLGDGIASQKAAELIDGFLTK